MKSGEMKGSFFGKFNEEKRLEKKEVKAEDSKQEKKLKGDSGIDCHYCHGSNHMENDYMLRKKEENNKVKDEAYYSKKLEEVCQKSKNISLVARGEDEDKGTYQI